MDRQTDGWTDRYRYKDKQTKPRERETQQRQIDMKVRTQIHGCLSASAAVMRLAGLTVSMLLIRFFASWVTVSHSGDGY